MEIELDRLECLRLLGSVSICRVGVTIGALPAILPVGFVLRGDLLLIGSVAGPVLRAAFADAVVAVEADQIDEADHSGWSVLVRGRSFEVTDPAQIAAAAAIGPPGWAGSDGHLVAVHAHTVSGHRIVPS